MPYKKMYMILIVTCYISVTEAASTYFICEDKKPLAYREKGKMGGYHYKVMNFIKNKMQYGKKEILLMRGRDIEKKLIENTNDVIFALTFSDPIFKKHIYNLYPIFFSPLGIVSLKDINLNSSWNLNEKSIGMLKFSKSSSLIENSFARGQSFRISFRDIPSGIYAMFDKEIDGFSGDLISILWYVAADDIPKLHPTILEDRYIYLTLSIPKGALLGEYKHYVEDVFSALSDAISTGEFDALLKNDVLVDQKKVRDLQKSWGVDTIIYYE